MLTKTLSRIVTFLDWSATFLDRFPGRLAWLPLLGTTSVLALALFLVFPPVPLTPVALTGGGSSALRSARGAHVVARPLTGPPTARVRYLSLNLGDIVDMSPGPVSVDGHPQLLARMGLSWRFRVRSAGYTVLTVGAGKSKRQVHLFVSPMPARQVSREDRDWYRTQYGTGYANCGPAMVSMAALWAHGEDLPVQKVRDEIGYPYDDGAVSFDNIAGSLGRHRVRFESPQLAGADDLRRIVDQGHLAVVLIQSGMIGKVDGDPVSDLVGRYYDDDEGHYVIVKGYTLDGGYFVVYDPYPVDWETNGLRYGDGSSMIGENRFYSSRELFNALKTPLVLEVWPG